MILSEILVPLLNANEPEARLASIYVKEGQPVLKGSLLFTIETTKAASDIMAPADGCVRLLAKQGDILEVGSRLAVITEKADDYLDTLPASKPAGQDTSAPNQKPPGLRITNPALALAQSLGMDLSRLPAGLLITEAVVKRIAQKDQALIKLAASDKPFILVYGAGGHAKTIAEMILQMGTYSIAGILDDNVALAGNHVLGVPVLGTGALLKDLREQGVTLAANGVGGILDINIRVRLFEQLEQAGFTFPVLIHPKATVEPSSKIEEGVQVFANAYIGSEAVLHGRCMVNTNAVVSHDCEIGAYTHIAPGALLAGHVHVGARSLIGMGVTTSIGVQIGAGVRVGNGAILLADVPGHTIIQAGRFWTGKIENQP